MDVTDEAGFGARVLAKVAWRLLPLVAFGYGLSYIDRVNIAFAALQMNRDLKFSATVYGLGAGLFFLSYALLEIPSNMILKRVGARRWIARIMITWGVLAAGMMFVRTPAQFYGMRLLLGAAEAGFFPGVVYYLTLWFPSEHRGRAISRFYVAWPVATIAMGAVAGALLNLGGVLGLAGWQWLFLIEGAPAVLMGVVILFLLPDAPKSARWLSDDERRWLEERLRRDRDNPARRRDEGVVKALFNPLVLGFAAVNFINLGCFYAFNLSAPTVLAARTHLSAAGVGYLVAAGGVLATGMMLFNGWSSDRTRERYVHLAAPLFACAVAYGVLSVATAPALVIGAYWLAIVANAAIAGVFWLAPGDVLAPKTMALTIAAINTFGQAGSFVLSSLWGVARDATGGERLGLSLICAAFLAAASLVLLLRRASSHAGGPKAGGPKTGGLPAPARRTDMTSA